MSHPNVVESNQTRKSLLSPSFIALLSTQTFFGLSFSCFFLLPIGALVGLAQGVFYPLFNALAIDGVPARQRGSMMALYHGGFNGGVAGALLLGGAVAERLGYPALFALSSALTTAAALLVTRRAL